MALLVCLFPAFSGTGIVSALVPRKLLLLADTDDFYRSATRDDITKSTFDINSKTTAI